MPGVRMHLCTLLSVMHTHARAFTFSRSNRTHREPYMIGARGGERDQGEDTPRGVAQSG